MFPIFFDVDPKTGRYIYLEVSIQFQMPLDLMLRLKKHLREEANPRDMQPIWRWYSSLEEQDAKEIVVKVV